MTKVYVLGIYNYDALDGYMTSTATKAFFNQPAFEVWMEEETKRQARKGFKLSKEESYPNFWVFVKKTLHGNYRHEFYGHSCEVFR